jgi:opacity protein-like surface antigen
MRKLITTVALSSVLASSLLAVDNSKFWQDENFEISLSLNEDTKPKGSLFVPYNLSENLYLGVGFKSELKEHNEPVKGFTNSDSLYKTDDNIANITFIGYKASTDKQKYSVALNGEYRTIDKSEDGYAYSGTTKIEFNNSVDIKSKKLGINAKYSYKLDDKSFLKLDTNIYPYTDIDVTQKTHLSVVATDGIVNTGKSQDISFNVNLKANYDISDLIGVGAELNYDYLPLKYDIQTAKADFSGWDDTKVDIVEKTTTAVAKMIFHVVDGISPYVGVGVEKFSTVDNITNSDTTETQTIVKFGLATHF